MRFYRCDRCGNELPPDERFCGHVDGHIGDFCFTCHEELQKDMDAVERLYRKQKDALLAKYGFVSIREIINRREER